ncbi:PspC domain-containing protein [Clostridiaceae bacterium M8S5]|nr:PspC domain-containing protein [Clostridiaceae bacterium M8S5]
MSKKLYRSRKNEQICGVCAGIAEYLDIDVTIVRIITVISAFMWIGFIPYIICAIVIPVNPDEEYSNHTYDEFDERKSNPHRNKKILGIILVFIGASIILERFLRWFNFKLIFSIILIFVGISFLTSLKRNK